MFPTIETDRLRLREIEDKDSQALFDCFSKDEVTQFYGQDKMASIEQVQRLVELFATNFKSKRGIRWGIERKDSHGLIGTIGYNAWLPQYQRAEIGYELHPVFWHQGYMTEEKSIITYGFEKMNLNRIGAVVFLENEPSNQLLEKLGFQKEGVLRKYMVQNGVAHDTYMYGLLLEVVKRGDIHA
ncbi:GNAT family protein [Pontibacillus salipaludis]|uniref:GNAT family N-acetyltransferase n=1 Tax=Pontibacillus salipaludis TaxID=1697394 RepID=UPI0031EDAE22